MTNGGKKTGLCIFLLRALGIAFLPSTSFASATGDTSKVVQETPNISRQSLTEEITQSTKQFAPLGSVKVIVKYQNDQSWLRELCESRKGQVFSLSFSSQETCTSEDKSAKVPSTSPNIQSKDLTITVSFGEDGSFLLFKVLASQGKYSKILLSERFPAYAEWRTFGSESEFLRHFANLIADAVGIWSKPQATLQEEKNFIASKTSELQNYDAGSKLLNAQVLWDSQDFAFKITNISDSSIKMNADQFVISSKGRLFYREFIVAELAELMIKRTKELALEKKLTTLGIMTAIGQDAASSLAIQTSLYSIFRLGSSLAIEVNTEFIQLQIKTLINRTVDTETETERSSQSMQQEIQYAYQEYNFSPGLRFMLNDLPNRLSGLYLSTGLALFRQKFTPAELGNEPEQAPPEAEGGNLSLQTEAHEASDLAPAATFGYEYFSDTFFARTHSRYFRLLGTGFAFDRFESLLLLGLPLNKILPTTVKAFAADRDEAWTAKLFGGLRYSDSNLELNLSRSETVSKIGLRINLMALLLGMEINL